MNDELKNVFYCGALFQADDAYLKKPMVTEESIKAFKDYFEKYIWAIDGRGVIRNHDVEEEVRYIAFVIDFDDPRTIASFNKLPQFFSKSLSPILASKIIINVFYIDDDLGDNGIMYDAMVIINGNLCLRDFHKAMKETQEENLQLMKDVIGIMRDLPDILN